MPRPPKDPLFKLVKTMSKAEKRSFKLYANRTMSDQERKFLLLFDLLDKAKEYDEALVRKKLPNKPSKGKFANLKRHLFKQLLTSLRQSSTDKLIDIQIREQIDFAKILYTKGLYIESLRSLERIKQIAIDHHQDLLHLEIIEFQKLIEARHVTRSRQIDQKMENLLEDSIKRSRISNTVNQLINLNIEIHGYYIEHGHAITKEDHAAAKKAWKKMKVDARVKASSEPTFFEKVNRYQADMWHSYILMDFHDAKNHARKWVTLFKENPEIRDIDPDIYMRGYYYLLAFLYLTDEAENYKSYLTEFRAFIAEYDSRLNPNSHNIGFVYYRLSRLNYYILTKSFDKGYRYCGRIKRMLNSQDYAVDDHRRVLFYYKFAAVAFALGKYDEAEDYLAEIINFKEAILRAELHVSARLLQLMCFYKNEDFSVMSYRLTSLSRSMGKNMDKTHGQRSMLKLLKRLLNCDPSRRKELLEKELIYFEELEQLPHEKKSFKYLDIVSWIRAELGRCTIAELMV